MIKVIEHLQMSDGTIIELNQLLKMGSADLFQTDLHYEIDHLIALQHSNDPELIKIIENLLALKSNRSKIITKLFWTLLNNELPIEKVYVSKDIHNLFKIKAPQFLKQILIVNGPEEYISKKSLIPVLIKTVLHRIFRLLSKKPTSNQPLMRAWCEVTEAMFPEEIETSEIRIYPFAFSFKRQLLFIKNCLLKKRSFSLDGLPYSIREGFYLVFISKNKLLHLAELEQRAFSKYAKEVLTWNSKIIYTSDEFEAGSLSLYTPLIQRGFSVINCAHGIGYYCPFVNYTHFWSITLNQGEFYQKRNPSIQVIQRQTQNKKIPLSYQECLDSNQISIVLIHQNFMDTNLVAESEAQTLISKQISKICQTKKIDYLIKLHPNVKVHQKKLITEELQAQVMTDWTQIQSKRLIFVVINSTAFYELRSIAPVLIYAGKSFFPEVYFGENLHRFDENNLEATIEQLMNLEKWKESFEKQLLSH